MHHAISQFCSEKGIELIALYIDATHMLQFSTTGTLKLSWK